MVEINLSIYIAYLVYITTKKAEGIHEMKYPESREKELLLELEEEHNTTVEALQIVKTGKILLPVEKVVEIYKITKEDKDESRND